MPYQRVTLSSLKTRLREKTGNESTFWNPDEVRDALNEGICYWQGLTGEWTEVRNMTAPGTAIFQIPTQCASLFRVSYVSSVNSFGPGVPLSQTTFSELDMSNPGWQGLSVGTPEMWAPEGLNYLAVYPVPLTGYLILEAYKEAPVLFSDPDYIDVGDEELTYILGYAQWYLAFKEGVQEAGQNVSPLLQRMVEAAVTRNKRLKASAYYRAFMGEQRDEEFRPGRAQSGIQGVRTEAYSGKK